MANTKGIVLITGGSRGLGRDMALSVAGKGLDVIITYNSKKEEAERAIIDIKAKGVQAVALQLNVADTDTFSAFVDEVKTELSNTFGTDKISYLINNAGTALYAPFADTTEQQFDEIMTIHLKAPYFLTQKLLPLLADGGGIINISSGLARFTNPGSSAYAAMKGAMEVVTRYQAKELGSRGIRSNIVAPGAIATDFGGGRVRDNEDINKMVASVTALGRVGLPHDIGGVVAFLCTEDAKWVNAQRIEVSGGQSI